MNLKKQYSFGLLGLVLAGWGGGMVSVNYMIGAPVINTINALGLIVLGLGLAITIKMLSTIKKIDLEVD